MRAMQPPQSLAAAMPAYPSRGYAWYVVGVLLLALTVSFVDRQILSLMVGPIRTDLGITDTQISLLQGLAFVIFYSSMGIVLGRWADRGHRQRMIIAGILVWSLATAACGLARNFHELFIARIFVGIGEATLSPAAYSIIADYFPRSARARAMSVFSIGSPMGAGLALILGGLAVATTAKTGPLTLPLIGMVHAWQAAFFLVGLPGCLLAVLMLSVREPQRQETAARRHAAAGTWQFLRSRQRVLSQVCIGFGITSTIVFGFGAWLPTTFMRVHGWAAKDIATASGLSLLIFGIGGIITAGQIADRSRFRNQPDGLIRIAIIAVLLLLPAVPIVGMAPSPWAGIAALCWVNFFVGMPAALAVPALQGVTPNEHRGQVTALYLLTSTVLGLALGPVLIALCTDRWFANDLAVGKSMSLVTTGASAIALCVLLAARHAYAEAVREE